MPNVIDATGLTTVSYADVYQSIVAALQNIYGLDINTDPSSPDGQAIGIFTQAILDNVELIKQVNAMFDPDQAIGVILDQRVAINGILRQAGTFTTTQISITTDRPLTLYGLDQNVEDVFTVSDNAGTQWKLVTTQVVAGAGVYSYEFRAAEPGATLTTPNTINTQVTVILGVTAVNNPATYTALGLDEESDAKLKLRRQKSVSLASQGYLAGLLAALYNINGITSAFVYENVTGAVDVDGIPSHSIWVIVAGSVDPALVANAIYTKRNAGCGMKGAQSYTITQKDGSSFVVYWDVVASEDLYIKFNATSLDSVNQPNIDLIRSQLPLLFTPGVYEQVNINDLATIIKQIDPNTLVTSDGFSLSAGGAYTPALKPSAKNKQFSVTEPKIIILPMVLSPSPVSVAATMQQQFTPHGGYGALSYTMDANPSGGSVNPTSGLYTAGATPSVVDIVRVTDSLGNFATATVNVT